MFYKQFLKIINVLNENFVNDFDYWLATLPDSKEDNITISFISSYFSVPYSSASVIVKFALSEGILGHYYLVCCPNEECEMPLKKIEKNEATNIVGSNLFCSNCFEEYEITANNIYNVYRRLTKPLVSESEIEIEILKRLNLNDKPRNFNLADSLAQDEEILYKTYYNPDESAYNILKNMQTALDGNYNNTTEKGNALEVLSLELFKNIKNVTGTNKLKTYTNQFDCTVSVPFSVKSIPSIFDYLQPYFIVECKNESVTPSNTYFHKLSNIMSTNEAKIGIVISRKKASREDWDISYQQYLLNRNSGKTKIMLSLCDEDLNLLIQNKLNLLEYLHFKLIELTTNSRNATFDMFKK